jgi:hypothetical protein
MKMPKELKVMVVDAELTKREERVTWALRQLEEHLRRYVGSGEKDKRVHVWPLPVTKETLIRMYNNWQYQIAQYDEYVNKLL